MPQESSFDAQGVQFGLINMFRTNNPMLDMAIALMIPAVLNLVFRLFNEYLSPGFYDFWDWFRYEKGAYERTISYQAYGSSADNGQDERNNILQKAISLYIGSIRKSINYQRADYSLQAIKENYTWDNHNWEANYGSTVDQLNAYHLKVTPQVNEWAEVEKDLKFRITENRDEEGSGDHRRTSKIIHYTLKSYRRDGEQHIEQWIKKAFDWYKAEIGKTTDDSKYMYMLSNPKSDEEDDRNKGVIPARRYKLTNTKTFDTLFFPEKVGMLKLLDNFQEKKGKYAIPGFPRKLGLLLHGAPGTGKTSLIKALAKYTNRNIVCVNLARIKTNQELLDIMFSRTYECADEDMPVKLKFSDTIFVFEDIDAATKVVHRRGPSSTPKPENSSSEEENPATVGAADEDSVTISSHGSEDMMFETLEDSTSLDGFEGEEDSPAMAAQQLLGAIFAGLSSSGGDSSSKDAVAGPITKSAYLSSSDKLNLAGILECLDGILDAEDRIIVMTTNHPKSLDPALIRPGRIDKTICLTYVKAEAVISLTNLYYGAVTSEQKDQIKQTFANPNIKVTPAQIEQLASEIENVEDFIASLQSLQSIF